MSTINSMFVDGLLSTPLVLPAPVAGALAALFFVMVILAIRRVTQGHASRIVAPVLAIAVAGVSVFGIIDRLARSERAAEERALLERNSQLSLSATAPGSALSCLDGLAGEEIENACEKSVFADPQSAARAVGYISARLSLLADAAATAGRGGSDVLAALAPTRRAIELDRFGIAAHVLAVRDGCTAEKCAAFAMLHDASTLKANFKVHAFDAYVARYAAAWGKGEAAPENVPQASAPGTAPVASAPEPLSPSHPLDSRYDFPSSASIPPVSIMNAEPPPPPKEPASPQGAHPATEKTGTTPPVPPKRPQSQAASPPAR
ncbi:MAG TPA: hypothetical protein VFL68_12475 [Pseudolabrys sp.]|nr:hypothetical protein [Pseudolabrys sp.]